MKRVKGTLLGLAVIFAVWQALAMLIDRPVLPEPWKVLMMSGYAGRLGLCAGASMLRVVAAVLLAGAAGLVCCLVSFFSQKAEAVIYPVIYLLHPIPKIALLPVVLLFFGLGNGGKIFLLFLICFFPFSLQSREAVFSVDPAKKQVLLSLGASKLQQIRLLVLPAAAPALLEGLRISLGTALSVLFFSESFGSQLGLGAFILDAWLRVSYVEMYSGILVLSFCGFTLYRLLDFLRGRMSHRE